MEEARPQEAEDGQEGSGFLTPHPVVQMELPYLGPQPCAASERVFPGLPQVLWPRAGEPRARDPRVHERSHFVRAQTPQASGRLIIFFVVFLASACGLLFTCTGV